MNPQQKRGTGKKGAGDGITPARKRLMKELDDIMKNPPPLCTACLQGNNLFKWRATIFGPPNSVYEGGVFHLSMEFTKDYPFKPPAVFFLTKIYHCNVCSSGSICLDILQDKWSAALRVPAILMSICSLLTDCNPRSPLEANIAKKYVSDRAEHDRLAREYTKRWASA